MRWKYCWGGGGKTWGPPRPPSPPGGGGRHGGNCHGWKWGDPFLIGEECTSLSPSMIHTFRILCPKFAVSDAIDAIWNEIWPRIYSHFQRCTCLLDFYYLIFLTSPSPSISHYNKHVSYRDQQRTFSSPQYYGRHSDTYIFPSHSQCSAWYVPDDIQHYEPQSPDKVPIKIPNNLPRHSHTNMNVLDFLVILIDHSYVKYCISF